MKRDLELVRKILFAIEAKPDVGSWLAPSQMNLIDWSEQEVNYHLLILEEAGYIKTIKQNYDNETHYFALRLTWDGHEFLEAARDDTRWNKAVSTLGRFGTFAFDILKPILVDIARQSIRAALNLPPV